MPRTSKRSKQLKQAREVKSFKNQDRSKKVILFIISLIFTGIPYLPARIMFLLNGDKPPTPQEIKLHLPEVISALKVLAEESVQEARDEMPENSVITLDGSWDHRRNGKVMILDVICQQTHKIVDFELVYKTIRKFIGNYEGPSNLMESEGFKRMIPRLMHNGKITELIKDGDIKISKIIQEAHWSVNLKNDPNHQLLHFDTFWKKWNSLCDGKLHGLKGRTLSYLKNILYEESTTETKLQKWENVVNHFTGNHKNCPPHSIENPWIHSTDQSAIDSLKGLVNDLSSIIKNFERYHTTNFNENFHSIKAHLLIKNNYQGLWAIGRILAAILQYNNPDLWIFKLLDYFHLVALPLSVMNQLYQIFKQRADKRNLDHSPKYQKAQSQYKSRQRKQFSIENSSHNTLAHLYSKKIKD